MIRNRRKVLAALVATGAVTVSLLAPATSSGAATYAPAHRGGVAAPMTYRSDTVARANSALSTKHWWMYTGGTDKHLSTLHLDYTTPYNYLGADDSNSNRNSYNGFNGEAWCGYFAAEIWTGTFLPNASDFPNLPPSYASSQAWAGGDLFHPYNVSVYPGLGDALVWQDDGSTTTGHVGVVVAVNRTTHIVTTIEGNQWVHNADGTVRNRDSIVKKTYSWTHAGGPYLSGKHFRGFRARVH